MDSGNSSQLAIQIKFEESDGELQNSDENSPDRIPTSEEFPNDMTEESKISFLQLSSDRKPKLIDYEQDPPEPDDSQLFDFDQNCGFDIPDDENEGSKQVNEI